VIGDGAYDRYVSSVWCRSCTGLSKDHRNSRSMHYSHKGDASSEDAGRTDPLNDPRNTHDPIVVAKHQK